MRNMVVMAAVVALAACGDPATKDRRGYTKAPLETPGLVIRGEPVSELDVEAELEAGLTAVEPAALESDEG